MKPVAERRPGHTLDADSALHALRAAGCAYRPDTEAADGEWRADCPHCRAKGTLRIREQRERNDEHRNPPVTVGCTRRCAEPAQLAAMLAVDPDMLEAREEARRLRARYAWAVDLARRALAGDERDQAPKLAVAA